MHIVRKAQAKWQGTLKEGKGHLNGQSGLDMQYAFSSRFEDGPGTNPEELLAAAHAGCYSMALNLALEQAGHRAEHVQTEVSCHLERIDGKLTVTKLHLATNASVPGLDDATFQKLAQETKDGCIVSRALAAVPMELEAKLV